MKKRAIIALIPLAFLLLMNTSCKPLNIFSSFVDTSNLDNEGKIDAGKNAIADGDYDEAIDLFTDVINDSSGDEQTEAYLGRGDAYLNKAAPNLDEVTSDVINGDLEFDSPGEVIDTVVSSGGYEDFFDNVGNAADDYNAAADNGGSSITNGKFLEIYEVNMLAATGVGANQIAVDYEVSPWRLGLDVTLDQELDAITDESSTHPKNIGTWGAPSGTNGLSDHVDGSGAPETQMLGYLTNAFDALTVLEDDPPLGLDIPSLKQGINDWVTNGLGEAPLS
jgi:hypothetical protein